MFARVSLTVLPNLRDSLIAYIVITEYMAIGHDFEYMPGAVLRIVTVDECERK